LSIRSESEIPLAYQYSATPLTPVIPTVNPIYLLDSITLLLAPDTFGQGPYLSSLGFGAFTRILSFRFIAMFMSSLVP
jgi:hypothetical protein